jgi:hypothetical protein
LAGPGAGVGAEASMSMGAVGAGGGAWAARVAVGSSRQEDAARVQQRIRGDRRGTRNGRRRKWIMAAMLSGLGSVCKVMGGVPRIDNAGWRL